MCEQIIQLQIIWTSHFFYLNCPFDISLVFSGKESDKLSNNICKSHLPWLKPQFIKKKLVLFSFCTCFFTKEQNRASPQSQPSSVQFIIKEWNTTEPWYAESGLCRICANLRENYEETVKRLCKNLCFVTFKIGSPVSERSGGICSALTRVRGNTITPSPGKPRPVTSYLP